MTDLIPLPNPPWPTIDGKKATAQELADFYFDMGRRFGNRERQQEIDRLIAALLRFTNTDMPLHKMSDEEQESIFNQAAGVLADMKF